MTEVVLVQSSNASSSMQRNIINNNPTRNNNDGLYQHFSSSINNNNHNNNISSTTTTSLHTKFVEEVGSGGERKRRRQQQKWQHGHRHEHEVGVGEVGVEERDYQVELNNFVGLFFTAFRRSVLGCSSCENITTNNNNNNNNCCNSENNKVMEISLPTNVRHVAHVTFDRFNGFLGLPVEFEPEVPRRPPSASTTVFGVSTNSMQLSFDTRGNSVPTILLMMQHRLYALGGLQAEGIFRINPDNAQEEHVRAQLNRGLVPESVDVHCLAGLIKAWFRELPAGVLDCLSPEQVMQSQSEQECTELARLLPPTEFSLLDWAINLMADVAQFEHLNKMNARNVAMVFAPNMTHMADPLTALMHAVQVMNFLKTLIEKTLKLREDSIIETALDSYSRDPTGGNAHYNSLQTIIEENSEPDGEEERGSRALNSSATDRPHFNQDNDDSIENIAPAEDDQSSVRTPYDQSTKENENVSISAAKDSKNHDAKTEQAQHCNPKSCRSGQTSATRKVPQKSHGRPLVQVMKSTEKAKGTSLVSSMNLRSERVEAWR